MPPPLTPAARHALAHAAQATRERGRPTVFTDALLLGVSRGPVGSVLELHGVTPPAIEAAMAERWPARGPGDDVLLARLGIDAAVVRQAAQSGGDEGCTVRRSPTRPLRVLVLGAGAPMALSGQGRKALEVAQWYARRRGSGTDDADLLRGLLCDRVSRSLGIVIARLVDRRALWADLDRYGAAAA